MIVVRVGVEGVLEVRQPQAVQHGTDGAQVVGLAQSTSMACSPCTSTMQSAPISGQTYISSSGAPSAKGSASSAGSTLPSAYAPVSASSSTASRQMNLLAFCIAPVLLRVIKTIVYLYCME